MDWYFADAGKPVGPFTDNDFNVQVANGTISPDTQVWHVGMKDWQPYATVASATAEPVSSAPIAPAGSAFCSQCGEVSALGGMIVYQEQLICVNCREVFFHRLHEGTHISKMLYAGFWTRFAAKFLDGIILNVICQVLAFGVLGLESFDATTINYENLDSVIALFRAMMVFSLLATSIQLSYSVFFVGTFGATPGKMAARIRIVRADGSPLTYRRALGRFLAEGISSFTLMLGYLMAAFDGEKRSLHDRICDTRVIKNRS
jgi:uncharacterized RDD family membrane protein YckC